MDPPASRRPARFIRSRGAALWTAFGALAVAAACSTAYAPADEVTTPRDDAQAPDATDATGSADASDAATATGPCTAPLTDGWSAPVRLADLRGAATERYFVDPFVTSDGLTLLLVNGVGAPLKIYRATRPSRDAAWSTATELSGYTGPTDIPIYPTTAAPNDEIVIAALSSLADIHTLTRDEGSSSWTPDVITPLTRPELDLFPTVTADGLMLVYEQMNANPNNPFRVLLQTLRSKAGDEWGLPEALASPPYDGGAASVDWRYPALTPNGLGLFYSVATEPDMVYLASRKTRQEQFFQQGSAAGVPIPALVVKGYTTRVRSITEDGCEMYLTSDRDGVLDAYVAKRTP